MKSSIVLCSKPLNSAYVVFRNVKDYGALGDAPPRTVGGGDDQVGILVSKVGVIFKDIVTTNSDTIYVYGAGLYSFFDNYSQACISTATCQTSIVLIDNSDTISIYNLNTIGAQSMVDRDGVSLASSADNANVYPATIAVFRTE